MVYKLASEVCAAYHQNCSDYTRTVVIIVVTNVMWLVSV